MQPGGERVVRVAQRWIGTPYRHQASCEGAGADCLGLLRGIWREVAGAEPEAVPPYSPHWAEVGTGEPLLSAATRHLVPVAAGAEMPGDVLAFRMSAAGAVKHVAILVEGRVAAGRMVHAYSGHSVCETAVGPWGRRLAAIFRFPGGA